jgi:hypothetical protein
MKPVARGRGIKHVYPIFTRGLTVDPNTVANLVRPAPDNAVAMLGVMIPIVAIVMGLGIGMLKLWLDYRKKREILQTHHAERMAAIEKGIELPPLPPQFYGSESRSQLDILPEQIKGRHLALPYLRSGLIWLLVGIAISVALYANHDHGGSHTAAWWGGVPIAFGLSKLLFYFIANRMNAGAAAPGDQSKPKE